MAPNLLGSGECQTRRVKPSMSISTIPEQHSAIIASAKLLNVQGKPLIPRPVISGTLRIIECTVLVGLGLLIKHLYVQDNAPALSTFYFSAIVLGAALYAGLSQWLGLYDIAAIRSLWKYISRTTLAWVLALAGLATLAFLLKLGSEFSRVWLAVWFVGGFSGLLAIRITAKNLIHHWTAEGRLTQRAAIIGAGHTAQALIANLQNNPESDIEIVGVFDDRNTKRIGEHVDGYPLLGSTADLVEAARESRIDLLIVTLPLVAENRLVQILSQVSILPIDIKLAAQTSRLRFLPRTYSYIGNVAMLDVADKPISGWDQVTKSVFDRVVGTLALIALSPVMLLTALAIKWDSRGPILFKQKRYGLNNELIEVYKFRSMYTDMSDVNAAKLVTKDDPRVTPVGRFIRKTSIDELPQLFNVLIGNLSLVGPRPHATQAKAADALYQDVVAGYYARHKVKPGITGWAQINGWRGETDTELKIRKRVEHDLYYIENWSLFLDTYILLKTPASLLNTESAY